MRGCNIRYSACAVTDARRPVSWVPALLTDELANALLHRGDCHRRTGGVMLRPGTQVILQYAVHAPPGNPGPAGRQTSDLLQITKYRSRRKRLLAGSRSSAGCQELSLPLDCPSEAGGSPVRCSNCVLDLGGAMGIRTPDLLHAMKHQQVP